MVLSISFLQKKEKLVDEAKARMTTQNEMIKKSIEASKNVGKR